MITIPVEDMVFVVCTLVGGALLLVSVLLDDVIGGILDSLGVGVDIGGTSLMPLALSFVAMFGVGGLFATQILDLHGGPAAVIGAVFGTVGASLAWVLISFLRRSETPSPFSISDLVGGEAYVAVAVPAGHYGSVYVKAEGQTHEISATSSVDIAAGSIVQITGVAGTGLIVAPLDRAATETGGPGATGEPTA